MDDTRFVPVVPIAADLLAQATNMEVGRRIHAYGMAQIAEEAAKKATLAAFVAADGAKNLARNLEHLRQSRCAFYNSRTEPDEPWFHLCIARAKSVCPNCGGPFCGSHDYTPRSKARPDFRGHECGKWRALAVALGLVGTAEEAAVLA